MSRRTTKNKPAKLVGPMKVLEYVEWDERDEYGNVVEVVFHENDATLVWEEYGVTSLGRATTTDGKTFTGKWKENPPGEDYGRVTFTLFRAVDGEALLNGACYSVSPKHGGEVHFFLWIRPQERV
jgi:hypothetical protein